MKKWVSLLVVTGILVSCMTACTQSQYEKALSLIEAGEYTAAYEILEMLDDEQAKATKARFRFVPVKSVTTNPKDGRKLTITVMYNENDLPDSLVYVYPEGETHTFIYTYDEQGRLLQHKNGFDAENYTTIDYAYNKNGYLSKETITYPAGVQSASLYIYDDNNRLIQEATAYTSGDTNVIDYAYDENDNLIEVSSKRTGISRTTATYTYDANGNCVFYESDNGETYAYTYDEKGNQTGSVRSYSGVESETIHSTYDANGNLLRQEFYNYGMPNRICEYIYDDNGCLVKLFGTNYSQDPAFTYATLYTNDAYGNWIKKEFLQDDQSVDVTEVEYRLVYRTCEYPEIIEERLQAISRR